MSDERLIGIISDMLSSQARERKQQTEAYLNALEKQTKTHTSALQGIRVEMRVLGLLSLLLLGSLAGANVYLEMIGIKATTQPMTHISATP